MIRLFMVCATVSSAARVASFGFLAGWLCCSTPIAADELTDRLRQTTVTNLEALLEKQFDRPRPLDGFTVGNPYLADPDTAAEVPAGVCAVRFTDPERNRYELQSHSSPDQAERAGAVITHGGRCGTCSTLNDLAVYLERQDLTTPARKCARKWGAGRVKNCFVEQIGFSEACAESWAYNALNTRQHCRGDCIETYGLLNLLLHRYPAPNNRADGSLNACLQCDEDISGPGFRHSAGRTRRNSGIASAIQRDAGELRQIDHTAYFRE